MRFFKRAAALAVAIAALCVAAPSAFAAPAPGFSQFAGCPNTPATVQLCLRSETNSGHIQIGNTDTPINQQIVLSGGVNLATGVLTYTSQGGLMAPPLNVPGGLTGLTGLSEFVVNLITFGANRVYAQAILVGTPITDLSDPDNTRLILPVRLKLINPFLTSTCSIGSAASPITFRLTTGTTSPPPPNTPITGRVTPFAPGVPDGLLISSPNTFVDNAFSAPAASGCDLIGFGILNGLVNARVGLPSAAGRNTAVLSNTTLKAAFLDTVYP